MKKILLALVLCGGARGARAEGVEILFGPGGADRHALASAPTVSTVPTGEFVVASPVVDLRRDPAPVAEGAGARRPYAVDPLQETQVLYGETVYSFEEKDGWVRVEAPEQPEYTHGDRWRGYPGWVPRSSLEPRPSQYEPNGVVTARYGLVRPNRRWFSKGLALPMGSRLYLAYKKGRWYRVAGVWGESGWMRTKEARTTVDTPRRAADIRGVILRSAEKFLGEPYYWGGRAGHRGEENAPSGVDCSGLVNVAYRVAGLEIPRDAHEQFMASRAIARSSELEPGDLVFLAKTSKPDRMVHVMIFAGGEQMIEAVHEENVVRRVTFKKKLGEAKAALRPGQTAGGYVVTFGRLIPR
jgi:cell wall-associated NlpC family hydrolase